VDDYPRVVKLAREKMGLSQQDLAFRAKEKLTVIQKIELEKMLPTMRLTRELEHILRVKLLVPKEEVEVPTPSPSLTSSAGATLGDVALVRQKDRGNKQT
jgi:putative transcription factor